MSTSGHLIDYIDKLEASGMKRDTAKLQVKMLTDVMDERLATKVELKQVEADLRKDIKHTEAKLHIEMKHLETTLKKDIAAIKNQLTIRLGAIMTSGVVMLGLFISALKFFH